MFTPNTYLKILSYLGWSIDKSNEVKAALLIAEANPEIEAEVKELLERLDAVSQSLMAEMGSANAGLIKADVLEWASPEARSSGMLAVKAELTSTLALLLGLEWSNNHIYFGGAMTVNIDVS